MLKLIEIFIYQCAFFPYIKFFNIGVAGNLQPYSFLITCLFILIYYKKFKLDISSRILLITSYVAISIFSIDLLINYNSNIQMSAIMDAIQSLYFYISGFIYFFAFKNLLRMKGLKKKYVKIIFFIWSGVAVLQLLIDKTLFTGWINKLIISSDRGVVSLSSEPSFFARMLILFAIIFYIEGEYKLFFIAIFENIFFARSLLGTFYLLISISFLLGEGKKN
ncbi:hypothetical protein FDG42_01370 [Clostridium botulinum]|uniref:hypothetical protein n=1 Tax=Clostridium botulinum TaxID=1491 RepID=UPI0013F070EA|nr:hypothetical protein [Clostridium botulinum]MCW6070467.1 hypothetical protein [Clostridium botulinum]MCW6083274.1 hypothetical protein [Clostridium botulinum]MCW6095806.1 hypothetical protein [Clostridium botulinum]NFH09617.1 hypothetical protein [Clostridium botulinum]NFL99365.1 hypothetical protein [Clostridium botulinum]